MTYRIVLNRVTDLAGVSQRAREGLNPRNHMAVLAEELTATIHDGTGLVPDVLDRVLGALSRTSPLWWAIARDLRNKAQPGDIIYCTGEDVGVPVAALCGAIPHVQLAMTVHHVDRKKKRFALWLFGVGKKVSLFCAVSRPQVEFLKKFMSLPDHRVQFVWDQTDTNFFSPGPRSNKEGRSTIMSVGLEQRDYSTLAEATKDFNVDVRISGFSADTRVLARTFPDRMPSNMDRRFYTWPDLLQLYRDADIAVVSLHPNNYAAGVQALMEALSCGCAVIVTGTEGLEGYLESDAMRIVTTGVAAEMKTAISDLLENASERRRLSERATRLAREKHSCEAHVEHLAAALRGLSGVANA